MSYQTGTLANINDVLSTLASFLAADGWTIVGNWREFMVMSETTSPSVIDHLRYGRKVFAHKGNKYVGMQDFYIGPTDIQYGTNGGSNQKNGPGIALVAGTGFGIGASTDPGNNLAFFPTFANDVSGAPGSTTTQIRTAIMPLPSVNHQDQGTMAPGDPAPTTDGVLAAPFGPVGGSPVPMPYWIMSDATGDNVILVVKHDSATTFKNTYLFFGDLRKSGPWTDTGVYFGASHSNINAFTGNDVLGHEINRFGPPAAQVDGGPTFLVHLDVDTTTGKWPALCSQSLNPGTGRRLSSSSEYWDGAFSGLAVLDNGVRYSTLARRRSSLYNSAPLLPTKIYAERDSGLWSEIGDIPNIYQALTDGFAPGTEWTDGAGNTYVVFDHFAVLKVP